MFTDNFVASVVGVVVVPCTVVTVNVVSTICRNDRRFEDARALTYVCIISAQIFACTARWVRWFGVRLCVKHFLGATQGCPRYEKQDDDVDMWNERRVALSPVYYTFCSIHGFSPLARQGHLEIFTK